MREGSVGEKTVPRPNKGLVEVSTVKAPPTSPPKESDKERPTKQEKERPTKQEKERGGRGLFGRKRGTKEEKEGYERLEEGKADHLSA